MTEVGVVLLSSFGKIQANAACPVPTHRTSIYGGTSLWNSQLSKGVRLKADEVVEAGKGKQLRGGRG